MSQLEAKRVGFVGGGAMAEALAGGLIAAGLAPKRIRASDPEHLAGAPTRARGARLYRVIRASPKRWS